VTKLRLNDITIRQLQPPETGQARYFDETTPGFGLTVGTRTKTFFVIRGKKRTLTTIGRYPDISLADARKEAKRLLVQEPEETSPTTVQAAAAAFLADCQTRLRPASVSAYELALRNAPEKRLVDLSRHDVDISNAHVTKAYKALYNWCLRDGLVDKNPFQYTQVKSNQRSRVLSPDEIKVVWQYDHEPYSNILKLCLLTGQRVGEVTAFCPEWIKGDTIIIPASVAKNGKEHTIPFNLLTAKYLKQYQHQTFNGHSKGKARFDRLHPLPHWTTHDLRRTFATVHAQLGTPIHVVEAMLNHTSGTVSGVAAIYIRHNFLAEMRKYSLIYETWLAKLVGAEQA
jgi:integrase